MTYLGDRGWKETMEQVLINLLNPLIASVDLI